MRVFKAKKSPFALFLLALVMSFLASFPFASGADQKVNAVETRSIVDSLGNPGPGNWVILDLDETLVVESQLLGRDEWHSWYAERMMQEKNISYREAVNAFNDLNTAIKARSSIDLTEAGLAQAIANLQAQGVIVFSITSRHPQLADLTLQKLQSLHVNFKNSSYPSEIFNKISWSGLKHSILFKDGIFFTDGADKGAILERIVEAVPQHPQFIEAFDDKTNHVTSFLNSLNRLDLRGTVFHYRRGADPRSPWLKTAIAQEQLRDFVQHGGSAPILSDSEAFRRLHSGSAVPYCNMIFLNP